MCHNVSLEIISCGGKNLNKIKQCPCSGGNVTDIRMNPLIVMVFPTSFMPICYKKKNVLFLKVISYL